MFKKVLLILAAVIGGLAAYVALQPNEFRVSRSMTMAAEPAAVFAEINDFHRWQAWSPWAQLDPNAKVTFEGPAAGEGAIFRWVGNDDVGEGHMTIVACKPHERIGLKLTFIKPMPGDADVEFTFQPAAEKSTTVQWTMTGKNDFFGKAMCLVMNMDKMIGSDYERGLANIKKIVESPHKPVDPLTHEAKPAATAPAAGQPQPLDPPDPVDPFKK